jgi:oligopeptide transport system ATP-binding protein
MSENQQRKPLLSLQDVCVKFNVRGRILTAIRNVSLDIYEHESIAIVGESGSGKSVLTKTFAGMLDSNGFISQGHIIFADEELSETNVALTPRNRKLLGWLQTMLNRYAVLERGAEEYRQILAKRADIKHIKTLTEEEEKEFQEGLQAIHGDSVDLNNYVQTLDKKNEADLVEIRQIEEKLKKLAESEKALQTKREQLIAARSEEYKKNAALRGADEQAIEKLIALRRQKMAKQDKAGNPNGLSDQVVERNKVISYEILLSIGRYPFASQLKFIHRLAREFKQAMRIGEDLTAKTVRNRIFQTVAFHVEFRALDEAANLLRGYAVIDCSCIKYTRDWQLIRGRKIATVFQDPMTSLNPVLTIGKQIMTIILKHQKCSTAEAKERTIDIMRLVGIPEPEKRFDDYPFQYSGGMRQRIVIAIALSCQPKILICDEPTTALDVTIQAQILQLIKDLQQKLGFTIVYITHDLGVVASVAERVAVLYAGQIVEIGTAEEIFFDPKHPYTWALLSSMPQLSDKDAELFSIPGTPPSLYNKIVGDAFAPRNQYAMEIDRVAEPPMFRVSDTHYAKTWLLDPRAPKLETPQNIQNLHEKMTAIYANQHE